MEFVFDLENVSVDFGSVRALDAISLRACSSEIIGLVGRNGAGKSTAVKVLAGLIVPMSGSVSIFGMPQFSEWAAILGISGFLLDEPALFGYASPRETLHFLGAAYGLSTSDTMTRAADLLAYFELSVNADRPVDELSVGTVKRLAIAAAMIHAPRLLVLDEPFESLDPLVVRRLKRTLREFADSGGTVLVSSHILDAVAEIANRVAIWENGHSLYDSELSRSQPPPVATAALEFSLEDTYAQVLGEPQGLPSLEWLITRA